MPAAMAIAGNIHHRPLAGGSLRLPPDAGRDMIPCPLQLCLPTLENVPYCSALSLPHCRALAFAALHGTLYSCLMDARVTTMVARSPRRSRANDTLGVPRSRNGDAARIFGVRLAGLTQHQRQVADRSRQRQLLRAHRVDFHGDGFHHRRLFGPLVGRADRPPARAHSAARCRYDRRNQRRRT